MIIQGIDSHNLYMISNNNYYLSWIHLSFIMSEVDTLR